MKCSQTNISDDGEIEITGDWAQTGGVSIREERSLGRVPPQIVYPLRSCELQSRAARIAKTTIMTMQNIRTSTRLIIMHRLLRVPLRAM